MNAVHSETRQMLPFDVPRPDPPSWVDELRQAILWPDKQWAPVESLSILVACREMEAWLADSREYEKAHGWSLLSAIADFNRSVTQVGPDLRGTLGVDFAAATRTADDLRGRLESMTASEMAAYLLGNRVADRLVFARLSARWVEPDTRAAAWADLVEACRDPATDAATLAVRRDLFWELLRAGNYAAEQMSQMLAGVLIDSAFHVTEVGIWVGDISEADVERRYRDQTAGLTEEQQLTLCRRFVTTSPPQGQHVVWIAFDHAGPGTFYRKMGPLSFWNSEWLRGALKSGGPNLDEIPDELKDPDGLLFEPDALPGDENKRDVMLARVELDFGAWTDPVRAATEQAEAVVALAGFHVGDTRWQQMPGHLLFVDGRIRSMGTFGRTLDPRDIANGLYQGRMDVELGRLTPKLQRHLPITDKDLSEIVQAIRWWQEACRQPPLPAVLLHVRVLELVSQRAGKKKWYEYLDVFHRVLWIRSVMISQLGSIVEGCFYNYELHTQTAEDRTWVREFSLSIRSYRPAEGSFELDLRKGLDALPELTRRFYQHDKFGRHLRSTADRFNVAALREWDVDLAKDWRLLLDRLIRIRNALAHGGPIDDDAVASVRPFAEHLAAVSLSATLDGLLEEKSVVETHLERRHQAEQWALNFSSASSVSEALLGP